MELQAPIPKLSKLLRKGTKHSYKREDPICDTDHIDGIYYVASGFVKRFGIMANGTINVQSIFGHGDVFALSYVFEEHMNQTVYDGPETYYYEAMCSSKIYKLSGEVLKEALAKDPLLYRDLLAATGNNCVLSIQLLENHSLPNADKRVAHLLAFFLSAYGRRRINGVQLAAPLTQQDIADILSLTRETVSLAISSLKEQKLLRTSRNIVTPDVKRLQEFAHEA